MMAATQMDNLPEFSPAVGHSDYEDSQDDFGYAGRGRRGCCFWFPCFGPGRSVTLWERISTTPASEKEDDIGWGWEWWDKGLDTFKKVREWSELVAGPKWKTFIRRFNKGRGGMKPAGANGGKFHYDPSSYALNFDEGPGHNGYPVEDDDRLFRDFSSRYASIPLTAKPSFVEVGKDISAVSGS
ncbi:OLC1v1011205C1 [Oldenlandia corymbosa var. corymbosa]|uniref:OLC1v1011205C1 n=1 Tax=Oldenlandia corymbosa var. corymbosa TaxID=529605 RepID=A0AAV1DW37_OLDCO|nr:OLC1v1011205C1 [Oldenlandia corymbosa var. corymbosa]